MIIGKCDSNRSERQGRHRKVSELKEAWNQDTAIGTRTGSEAVVWAMSVLANAKSNRHRKTHRVEPDGAGRKFLHLTRGDLGRENAQGVSRGHSSDDAHRKMGRAKDRRTNRRQINQPRWDASDEQSFETSQQRPPRQLPARPTSQRSVGLRSETVLGKASRAPIQRR